MSEAGQCARQRIYRFFSRAVLGLCLGLLSGGGIAAAPVVAIVPVAGTSSVAGTAPVTAPSCQLNASPVVADVPWPQRRYDFAALSQISDGTGVTVGVIDSGVDARHPQLAGRVRVGTDLIDPGRDGRVDCVGHGTAIASIIAARPMAGSGLRGLAPGADIVPIRASERVAVDGVISGDGTIADVVAGVRAAVARDVQVISLSLSTTRDDSRLMQAIRAAIEADIVVVAAVGNQHERGDPTPYPAAYPGVIGVGAVDSDGLRVASSQVGRYVDIVAPGDDVIAAAAGGGHGSFQGTSYAAPFVAATAALIRARWPELDQAAVVRRLLATADPAAGTLPPGGYGHGVLNPMRALTEIVPASAVAESSQAPASGGKAAASRPTRTRPPTGVAIAVAVSLILAATGIGAVAAVTPLGRRRRWRPGR